MDLHWTEMQNNLFWVRAAKAAMTAAPRFAPKTYRWQWTEDFFCPSPYLIAAVHQTDVIRRAEMRLSHHTREIVPHASQIRTLKILF